MDVGRELSTHRVPALINICNAVSADIVVKNVSREQAMRAAGCREQHFEQVDDTDPYKSCNKWEIGRERSHIQGERGEKLK